MKISKFYQPTALFLEGKPMIEQRMPDKKGGLRCFEYRDMKNGELIGLREGEYLILQDGNKTIVVKEHTSDKDAIFTRDRVVYNSNGDILELSTQKIPWGEKIILNPDANGDVFEKRKSFSEAFREDFVPNAKDQEKIKMFNEFKVRPPKK